MQNKRQGVRGRSRLARMRSEAEETQRGPPGGENTARSAAGALLPGDLCHQECSKTWKQDGKGVWDEFSGLLTDRFCPRSTALYNEMGAEMPAFNDVSIHKMEGGSPQNCQLHLNKSVIKIKCFFENEPGL